MFVFVGLGILIYICVLLPSPDGEAPLTSHLIETLWWLLDASSFSKDFPRNSLMKYFPPISPCNENFSPELDAYCLPEKLIGLHFMWGIIIHRQTIFMFLVYKSLYFHCLFCVFINLWWHTILNVSFANLWRQANLSGSNVVAICVYATANSKWSHNNAF